MRSAVWQRMHYVLRHQQSFIRTIQIKSFLFNQLNNHSWLSSLSSTPRLPNTITNTLYIHISHTHSFEHILAVYLLGPLCLVLFSVCLCRDIVVSCDRSILSCIFSLLNEIGNPSYHHDVPAQANRRQIKSAGHHICLCPPICSLVLFSFGFLICHHHISSIFFLYLPVSFSSPVLP
jgi:hypothetical protein